MFVSSFHRIFVICTVLAYYNADDEGPDLTLANSAGPSKATHSRGAQCHYPMHKYRGNQCHIHRAQVQREPASLHYAQIQKGPV